MFVNVLIWNSVCAETGDGHIKKSLLRSYQQKMDLRQIAPLCLYGFQR